MSYLQLYLGEALVFIVAFFGFRSLNMSVIDFRLKKKSRAKGQSFVDWLFYRRFRDVLTWPFLVIYFGNIIYSLLIFILLTVAYFAGMPQDIARICWTVSLIPYFIVTVILTILTRTYGRLNFNPPDMDWIDKKVTKKKGKKAKKGRTDL